MAPVNSDETGTAFDAPILEQAVPELLEQLVQEVLSPVPWGHHIEITKKGSGKRVR